MTAPVIALLAYTAIGAAFVIHGARLFFPNGTDANDTIDGLVFIVFAIIWPILLPDLIRRFFKKRRKK